MATEGHYKELTDGYEVIQRADGITATRVFIDTDATADDSLPAIGDRLSDTLEDDEYECKVYEIQKKKHGGHPSNTIYTILYSTAPGLTDASGSDSGNLLSPDKIPVTGSLSAEAISIDGTNASSSWTWKDGGSKMDQQVFKRIVSGSFKVTKRCGWLYSLSYSSFAGKINSSVFKVAGNSFEAQSILFNGVEYEEYRNNTGLRRWRVSLSFSIKRIPYGGSFYGWNYVYDEKTNRVRQPYNTSSGTYLYETADLNQLLATPEAT